MKFSSSFHSFLLSLLCALLVYLALFFALSCLIYHTPLTLTIILHLSPHFSPSPTLFLFSSSLYHTADHNAAPDPELERKLREMEANQLNAWEEKEKLSQALEAERQANMNNVISEMMNGVKEQKVRTLRMGV